ncbi:hypothetical protein ZWY2020_056045 [Hordeum vulgare]|nr:hypothetical protein ZWY2020_056045 [Hordeum vulgare]
MEPTPRLQVDPTRKADARTLVLVTVSEQIGQRAKSPIPPTVPLPPTAREARARATRAGRSLPKSSAAPCRARPRTTGRDQRPSSLLALALALLRWGEEGFGAKWQDPARRPLRREDSGYRALA